MRSSFTRLSRIIDRDSRWLPQSWKYVEKNIKHAKWFWCRSPLRVAHDLWWWIRHRTTNRYHVLRIGSLTPGWWDVDTRLLHASFTLLESYVENEKPFKHIEWNDTDESREHANEIHSLYMWWKWRKSADLDYESLEEENERYNEETENLIRLMKIRMTLWT